MHGIHKSHLQKFGGRRKSEQPKHETNAFSTKHLRFFLSLRIWGSDGASVMSTLGYRDPLVPRVWTNNGQEPHRSPHRLVKSAKHLALLLFIANKADNLPSSDSGKETLMYV